MKIKINEKELSNIINIKDDEINNFFKNINSNEMTEEQAVDLMELLYSKSNEYLSNPDYNKTPESTILEKVADYIYDKTN